MVGEFGIMSKILLADIGNTHFHIYNGHRVEHLSYNDAIEKYAHRDMLYISVKHELGDKIEHIKSWNNISDTLYVEGEKKSFLFKKITGLLAEHLCGCCE
jgi:hypothetical protein